MNYERIYNALIQKRQVHILRKDQCWCERHHIVPKSFGGRRIVSNLVNLTPREHFVAHRLLARIAETKYGRLSKQHRYMLQALQCMANQHDHNVIKLTPRGYQALRKIYRESITGKNNRSFRKRGKASKSFGRKPTAKSIAKNRASHLGRKHMHHPTTDVGIVVPPESVDHYLSLGYVLGMSKHECISKGISGKKQKHMYHPITQKQVHSQPEDIQGYLEQGYVFGRSERSRQIHSEKIKGKLRFYDKDTNSGFYVQPDLIVETYKLGHRPARRALEKLHELGY